MITFLNGGRKEGFLIGLYFNSGMELLVVLDVAVARSVILDPILLFSIHMFHMLHVYVFLTHHARLLLSHPGVG